MHSILHSFALSPPRTLALGLALSALLISACASSKGDRSGDTRDLPSWNEGSAREAILDFVDRVSEPGSADFVPEAERIAVFDNDGTLWSEQPLYFQLAFALDRIAEQAPQHPEWKDTEPFQSVLAGDLQAAMAGGEEAILELLMASHAGISTEEFDDAASRWIETAKNPKTGLRYKDMTYQPMLELLDHLRAHGFKTFIVSGGGVDFMRVFCEDAYGIPPEQVIGSSIQTTFEMRDGVPTLIKQPKVEFIDDKAGKPVGIHRFIGQRPIFAGGNSDGDLQMIQYTAIANPRPGFGLLVHHTDDVRETAYDRDSHIGKLDKALDEAAQHGWTVVSMKDDWKQVFPPK